ncbi:MAG: GcrA family cell cycle regulator, partial [Alphaproteobacteria bacterium]
MAVDWTDYRVALLSDLWQSGCSARQIAERLGEGVTRNAVIGKANPLGLSKP